MKAVLINTPLHLQHDPKVVDTLQWIRSDLEMYEWSVIDCFADTGQSVHETLEEKQPDVVFCYDYNAGDGSNLRDICEHHKIPEVFSPSPALTLFLNKKKTKEIAYRYGFRVLRDVLVSPEKAVPKINFMGPYIVKPLFGGDSRGITGNNVFYTSDEALKQATTVSEKEQSPYMIEEYVGGDSVREIALFCFPTGESWLYATIEYKYDFPVEQKFRYLSKQIKDFPEDWQLRLSLYKESQAEKISVSSINFFKAIGAFGVLRAEFIVKKDEVILLEINGIPGINECFYLTAEANGISRSELTDKMFAGTIAKQRLKSI